MENRLFYAPLPEASMIQLAHKSPITIFSPLIVLFNLAIDTGVDALRLMSGNYHCNNDRTIPKQRRLTVK